MGNNASLPDWSKRVPDGPLFPDRLNYPIFAHPKRLSGINSGAFIPFFGETLFIQSNNNLSNYNPINNPCVSDVNTKSPYTTPVGNVYSEQKTSVESRSNRRRPTYSAKNFKLTSEGQCSNSNSDDELVSKSAKDMRISKLKEFKKVLTTEIKLKTAIFYEKVKITTSNDCNKLEWYKAKDKSAAQEHPGNPLGAIDMKKITSAKVKIDNNRCMEIIVGNVSYFFMFKTQQERATWQRQFDTLRKFILMI